MASFGRTRRCSHVKVTGHRCGSPALHGEELCYFHARLIQRVSTRLDRAISSIALLENEEAIQVSIMTVIDAILKGTIELKRATLILRAISIAERNSRRARFEFKPDEMVRDFPDLPDDALRQAEALAACHPEQSEAQPKSALDACHPERSEAQPSAVEGPHATQPHHRPDQEFPPQTSPLSVASSVAAKSALAMNTEQSGGPGATHPAYSEHELQTMRQREARRARPVTNQQAETNRALHELECSLQGAQRGDFKDFQTVLEAGGLLDEDGHL